MSIWCSSEDIGFEDRQEGEPNHGQVRSYASGFSNHYPTTDGEWEAPAAVGIASIAPWCVPGWSPDDPTLDHPLCGPWVRLDVMSWEHEGGKATETSYAAVVMDEAAARALAWQLLEWADRPHVHPREPQ